MSALARFTARIPTGVAGFDDLIGGGLFQGSSYLIAGEPGNGKTVFANQLAFHHVLTGGRVVYVTLLTETHDQMLAQCRSFTFFDPAPLAETLVYLSGSQALAQEGLSGLRTLLRGAVRDHQASLLIIDRLAPAEDMASSTLAFDQFLRDLQVYTAALCCTTLVLTSQPSHTHVAPWATLVDGVIRLRDEVIGQRAIRTIEIQKFRGSGYLRGRHTFEITNQGVEVYPRTEAVLTTPSAPGSESDARLSMGIEHLDAMLHGGLPSGSMTMLLGPSGSGKTSLGLHFLAAGARQKQVGLHFGFYEMPHRVLRKADQFGLPLRQAVTEEWVDLVWQPAVEDYLDRLVAHLLATVRRRTVRRLFIDGLDGLRTAAAYPERLNSWFTALTNELRVLDVTTVFSLEMHDLIGSSVSLPISGVSVMTDNLILLRLVEARAHLHRLVSILKMRDSDYDRAIREFTITSNGIEVAHTFEGAAAILSGLAQPNEPTPVPSGARPRAGRR
jgi:circadian clock protein KaiC